MAHPQCFLKEKMLPRAQRISQDLQTTRAAHLFPRESPEGSTDPRICCHSAGNIGHDGHCRLASLFPWGYFHGVSGILAGLPRMWEGWPLQFVEHRHGNPCLQSCSQPGPKCGAAPSIHLLRNSPRSPQTGIPPLLGFPCRWNWMEQPF